MEVSSSKSADLLKTNQTTWIGFGSLGAQADLRTQFACHKVHFLMLQHKYFECKKKKSKNQKKNRPVQAGGRNAQGDQGLNACYAE